LLTPTLTRVQTYLGMAKDGWVLNRGRTDEARRRARKHLIERMGRMRGLPQKLGQIMGFSHCDTESAEDYSVLQEAAEPLTLDTIQPILETEWGRPMDQVVRDIAPDASAASLGQVHRAILHDGREVAIKIQYPGIRDAVLLDLKMLGWLSVPVGNLGRGFDIAGYRDAILSDIERELDYRQEAEFQRHFVAWASQDPFLAVPQVIGELCTSKVLVSHWEEGDHWREVQNSWTQEQQRRLGVRLVRFFHEGLFQRGLLHADWHPGNLRFRRTGGDVQLLLYDFGCVYRPSDEYRLALLRLIRATRRQDEPPYPLFLKLGFRDDYLQAMGKKLPALCKVLFEPYTTDYPYDLRDWHLGERIGDVLGEDRWNFRIAGPAGLVFLLRAFHGLLYYVEGLQTRTAWSGVVDPLFEQFAGDLRNLDIERSSQSVDGFGGLARHLRIRVSENGCTKAQITYRAAIIDNLKAIIDDELQERIERQGVNLNELVAGVRRRCYAPGEVFRLVEGAKEVVVWLE
jgi:predicted unusual protein kinase regulating ubiquinone biosynthesis (AarF/ABC1/UbiB family)